MKTNIRKHVQSNQTNKAQIKTKHKEQNRNKTTNENENNFNNIIKNTYQTEGHH